VNHSEQINEIAAALSKAQAVIAAAVKDKTNPHYKSDYADLASVWDACRKPLTDNGLSVAQAASTTDGRVGVTTMLMHSSGQWLSDSLVMKPTKDDPQGVGSCITYARRYALAAMVGVAPADDDGNAASAKTQPDVVAKAPDGYEDWVIDQESAALNGFAVFAAAFKSSKPEFRDYRMKHEKDRHEALKAKASAVVVKKPELVAAS
jgi:hypothetical protein